MPPVRNIRNKLASLKKLAQEEYNLFQEQSSGRGRNRPPFSYRQQIANTEKQLRNAIGPRSGIALELNKARNNLARMKKNLNVEKNKIKVKVAPQKYRSQHYGSAYGGWNVALEKYNFTNLPKNQKNAIEKKLKNALNAHNKKIENAEKRVKNIENQAAKKAARLLERTPVINRLLHAPGTGMMYARLANTWPGGVKLPKNAKELATLLRNAERRGAKRARSN